MGRPYLEGIWTRDSEEPLQRPSKYKDKEFFTDQERAELDQLRTDILSRDASKERGTQDGKGWPSRMWAVPTTRQIYTSHLRLGKRTAMIVDPKDGRLPDLAPRAKQEMAALTEYLARPQTGERCLQERPARLPGRQVHSDAVAAPLRGAAVLHHREQRSAGRRRRRDQPLRRP